jgi:hypothetical protein
MDWRTEGNRAEWAVDAAAAAIFAAAVGFALWAAAVGAGQAAACIAAAFLVAAYGLRQVSAGTPSYALPDFPPATFEPVPAAEDEVTGELILEDALAEVSPDARVVRLFGPSQSQFSSQPIAVPPDASQALSEALAELRRSLH